jgi:hypothetical protein
MAGGLMQLVAYGAQDVYLTGNPKVTFFQAVYKRHTNFAMENIEQTVNGTASNSGRVSVTIARNGDLVSDMYVELKAKATPIVLTSDDAADDVCWAAERAIKDVELSVGGQRIDKHYQRWWRLYSELYLDDSKKATWGKMTSPAVADGQMFLPLIFFFNRNPGLALPLIALQYHEVRMDFDLSSDFSLYTDNSTFKVWANYIYLSTLRSVGDSRRRVMSTLSNKSSTLAPTLWPPPVPRSRSASRTTTRSRSWFSAPTAAGSAAPTSGTSRPPPRS